MQSAAQSSELRVTNRVQAAALENPLRARLLMACVAHERSLTDLQRPSGESLSKLHYHVTRLLDAGLLRVSREQARGGRPIRWFRAVAECFLVPQEFLASLPGEALAAELRNLLQMSRAEVSLRHSLDPRGQPMVMLVRDDPERQPKSVELWRILKLGPDQRKALAGELVELFARYAKAESKGSGDAILLHAAFAPRV